MDKDQLIGLIVVMILCALIGGAAAFTLTRMDIRSDAIEHRAAHWEIDATTGKKSFVWDGCGND